jgi:hypothetical protein
MKINEIAAKVASEHQYMVIRPRKGEPGEYDVKIDCGNKRGWTYIDGVTANLIDKIYNALDDTHKQKYINLPLVKLVDISWKLVK